MNELFKATISFESSNYLDIVLYLVYNGKEKLKGYIPQVKFKIWGENDFLTIDIENLKILEDIKNNKLITEVLNYVKSNQQLLLDYWNAVVLEYEAKQIFFDEKKEHFGCTTIDKRKAGLPVNLLLYCSYTLDRDNILFFQNDYGKLNYNKMVMMSVDKYNPKVLGNKKINIREEDMLFIKEFIKKNYAILTDYNNDSLTDAELFDLIFYTIGKSYKSENMR